MTIINIQAGEVSFDDQGATISTVVGSCIAFCVFDRRLRVGGMCHYAVCGIDVNPDSRKQRPFYYGMTAIEELLRLLKAHGCQRADLEVKIIGGFGVMPALSDSHVGEKNIRCARKSCEKFGLQLVAERVGGDRGMKIRFDTATGEVMLQRLGNAVLAAAPAASCAVAKSPRPGLRAPVAGSTRPQPATKPQAANPVAVPAADLGKAGSSRDVNKVVSVLIVDDSKVVQALLKSIVVQDKNLKVFGVASNPREAEALMAAGQPDVITLDVQMPEMDGITYLERHLAKRGIPTIMISGAGNNEGHLALKALELGAVDFVEKPAADKISDFARVISEKIITVSRVDMALVRNTTKARVVAAGGQMDPNKIVLIGSSTGGTVALQQILRAMPSQIPPIVIVQHIPEAFAILFAERLDSLMPFKVKIAANFDVVCKNQVLIAPGGQQLKLKSRGEDIVAVLTDDPPVRRHKPSVDYLFKSAAPVLGKRAIGVILTGMGADGAEGMLDLKRAGALTLGQDEASCVVFGMPREAQRLGAVTNVITLENMAEAIMKSVRKESGRKKASA